MESKVCIKCKDGKLISDFHSDKRNKDGYCGTCKICVNKVRKEQRVKDIENERGKEYYENNKDEVKKRQKIILKI